MSICTPLAVAGRGQELGVGEAGADHQQGVALLQHGVARRRPQPPGAAGDERQIVRDGRLPQEGLGHARPQALGDGDHLVRRAQRPGPHQHGHLAPGVEHLRRPAQIVLPGHHQGPGVAHPGVLRPVLVRRLLHRRLLLHVVGQDDAGHGALGQGDAERPVDDVLDLLRADHLLHVGPRHVLEQHPQVDLLLRPPAEQLPGLLPDDGHHRLMVERRVVEAVQGVDRPRPLRRQADAGLAGELGVGAGHQRGQLLVHRLDQLRPVPRPVEGAHDGVDPVPGVAEDALHAPRAQALHQEIGHRGGRLRGAWPARSALPCRLRHLRSPSCAAPATPRPRTPSARAAVRSRSSPCRVPRGTQARRVPQQPGSPPGRHAAPGISRGAAPGGRSRT